MKEKEIPDCCQVCKTHKNRPSWCTRHYQYVPRKGKPCSDYKRGDK